MNKSNNKLKYLSNEQHALIELLNCASHPSRSHSCQCCIESVEWETLLKLASKLNVMELVYPGLLGIQNKEKSLTDFISYKEFRVISDLHQSTSSRNGSDHILKKIKSSFNGSSIPLMLIKSSVTRSLYPNPEFIHVSEFELYIKKSDYDTSRILLTSLGYSAITRECSDCQYQQFSHPESPDVKLYWGLIPSGISVEDPDRIEEVIWARASTPDSRQPFIRHMALEDHFVILIAHLGVNIEDSGLDIRKLNDLMLFSRHFMPRMDFLKINRLLNQFGLSAFYETLAILGKRHFYEQWPTLHSNQYIDDAEFLMTDLFQNTVEPSSGNELHFTTWIRSVKNKNTNTKRSQTARKLGL